MKQENNNNNNNPQSNNQLKKEATPQSKINVEIIDEDKYLTPEAREIIAPKYNSVISDRQRTIKFFRIETFSSDAVTLMTQAVICLKKLFGWNLEFATLSLGTQLNLKFGNNSLPAKVVKFLNSPEWCHLTLFVEAKNFLFWFSLNTKKNTVFFKKHNKVAYTEQFTFNSSQERISPGGMLSRFDGWQNNRKRANEFFKSLDVAIKNSLQ